MIFFYHNRLAKVKEDVRKRRNEREQNEKLKMIESSRRKAEFERLFVNYYLSPNGRLEILVVKFDLYSFNAKIF